MVALTCSTLPSQSAWHRLCLVMRPEQREARPLLACKCKASQLSRMTPEAGEQVGGCNHLLVARKQELLHIFLTSIYHASLICRRNLDVCLCHELFKHIHAPTIVCMCECLVRRACSANGLVLALSNLSAFVESDLTSKRKLCSALICHQPV